jgi:hypothetical protein
MTESDDELTGRLLVTRALERVQREQREGEGWLDQLCRMLGVSEEFAVSMVIGAVVATKDEPRRDYAVQDAYGAGITLGIAFAREAFTLFTPQ